MADEDDPILGAFARARYPGSKQVIDEARKKRTSKISEPDAGDDEPALWVDNPYYIIKRSVGGKSMDFYTMAALCEALHRAAVTVRGWEHDGKFPKTPFRTKHTGRLGGKRLYTKEQIERTRAIADEEGLLYSQRPLTPRFTQRVTDLFNEIRTDIKKGN